ncbi:LysR family transcriptional regulator [Undibacterium sp. Ren11W]|uniref:LysR family transcriptional regulator n=1 Tax=Undibacterium sp. Ren11W TaxID=3413045 RepID=UPI003BF40021
MRLSLRQLQIFLAVCDHGSTAAAAGVVALSQSATSAALNELEHLLSTQLFDRVGKRLIINDNGRLLLPQARQVLDAAAGIEQQFSGADAGLAIKLRLAASTTIGIYHLPQLLAGFSVQAPQANPRVLIANTSDVATAVANFAADIGFIEGPCEEPDLLVEPWIKDELIVVCAPQHALLAASNKSKSQQKNTSNISLPALSASGWLLREAGSGTRVAVEHALLPHLHTLHCAAELSNSEAIKHAAAAGLGLACLSRVVVADMLALGSLIELNTALPPLQRHFYLVRSKHKILSARLTHFMQFCRDWH